ncbi:MAG: hypothetical protein K8S23_08195 [Candidatus Cloacimonetes bacterium]|nr:hypothetical protein [Candidatus Cloacimonadota bacterium]
MSSTSQEILRAIYRAIESKLHLIGSVIEGSARNLILQQDIKDKGDFFQNTGYAIQFGNSSIDLAVGSNVPHEQYVLGGKVPSWTPIEPLKAWVERKGLAWVDKRSGKLLSIEQMAYMIQAKIKREGIPARNVFVEVIKNKQQWIYNQLDNIRVVL